MAASSRAHFDEAIRLINAGDTARAERICRDAVASDERDVNMTALLGAVLLKTRQLDEAELWLRRAIDLAPNFAKPHEDLGQLLVENNRGEEAVTVLQRATQLDPRLDGAYFKLGKAYLLIGKGEEADAAFEQSFELNPDRQALATAARHHRDGRLDEAERLYRQELRKDPENVSALRLLGLLVEGAGRLEDAEGLLQRAVSLAPDFTNAWIDLGRVLQQQHRLAEAIASFARAIALEPRRAYVHFLHAAALAPAARTREAIDAYRRATELRPDHAGAWLGLGHVLKTVGRQEEGIAAYRRCLEIKPDNGEIYWSLANLKTYSLTDEDIREMETRVKQEGLAAQSEVNFLFALAKAHEDRGEFDRAWSYYSQGNAKQRRRERYDPVSTEVMNDSIIEVFDAALFARHVKHGHPDRSPNFIVGLPRSGSTLIEQILASHSEVEGTSELPYLGRIAMSLNRNRADGINYPEAVRELQGEHFAALGEDYLRATRIHRVEGTTRFIDKMPNNFPNVGFMHLILPNAKIIDARRNPLDACLSCYRQLFARGQSFTYDLTDIGEYYLEYQRMMDHWHEVLPGRVLTVRYEEVVTDLEYQVRRLLDYCGLPFEEACLRFHETDRPVRTASSEQVRQPIYTDAVNFSRNYAEHLGELTEILEPLRDRYDRKLVSDTNS